LARVTEGPHPFLRLDRCCEDGGPGPRPGFKFPPRDGGSRRRTPALRPRGPTKMWARYSSLLFFRGGHHKFCSSGPGGCWWGRGNFGLQVLKPEQPPPPNARGAATHVAGEMKMGRGEFSRAAAFTALFQGTFPKLTPPAAESPGGFNCSGPPNGPSSQGGRWGRAGEGGGTEGRPVLFPRGSNSVRFYQGGRGGPTQTGRVVGRLLTRGSTFIISEFRHSGFGFCCSGAGRSFQQRGGVPSTGVGGGGGPAKGPAPGTGGGVGGGESPRKAWGPAMTLGGGPPCAEGVTGGTLGGGAPHHKGLPYAPRR